jgi:CBS-domain-containing membrane protein
MLTVKDIMTKKVYTVEFGASAEEAAWGLTRRQIGAAPVKNAEGELVGILTKGDLVDPEPSQWIKKRRRSVTSWTRRSSRSTRTTRRSWPCTSSPADINTAWLS